MTDEEARENIKKVLRNLPGLGSNIWLFNSRQEARDARDKGLAIRGGADRIPGVTGILSGETQGKGCVVFLWDGTKIDPTLLEEIQQLIGETASHELEGEEKLDEVVDTYISAIKERARARGIPGINLPRLLRRAKMFLKGRRKLRRKSSLL